MKMDAHRLVAPLKVGDLKPLVPSDGNSTLYDIEVEFGFDNPAILRCFSSAITLGADLYCLEEIPLEGILLEDNEELCELGFWSDDKVYRCSFWVRERDIINIDEIDGDLCVGYAIFKKDGRSNNAATWYVFEAVFKSIHSNLKCISFLGKYKFRIGSRNLTIEGVLYCQQNGLNKACSQVALRSLLSRVIEGDDISYRCINELAFGKKRLNGRSNIGLAPIHIEKVVTNIGLGYYGATFSALKGGRVIVADDLPYLRVLYSGIEAGLGSFLGFGPNGIESKENDRHVIPLFGHTFDCDNWVAGAQEKHFCRDKSKDINKLQSDAWAGAFLGHDDNFGPNLLIPRHYIRRESTFYAGVILPPKSKTPSIVAEERGRILLDSIVQKHFQIIDNEWVQRIIEYYKLRTARVVLRTVRALGSEYFEKLCNHVDVQGRKECNSALCKIVDIIPEDVWVIEISLYPIYGIRDKIGEIVLDASINLLPLEKRAGVSKIGVVDNIWDCFKFVRVPGAYFVKRGNDKHGYPKFEVVNSSILSHSTCFSNFTFLPIS